MPTPAESTPANGGEPSLVKTPIYELTKTPVPIPTATETPDPLANAPEGTTGVDEEGNPIREVMYQNGEKVEFHLNEQGEWVNTVGEFPLIHNGIWEFSPFTISIGESVPGGRNIQSIIHPTTPPIESNRPLGARVSVMFLDRLGLSSSDPERYVLMNEEMPKGNESNALLHVITSDGLDADVRFSTVNGFKLNIVEASKLESFFQEGRAIQWFDGHGGTYYLRVTVDDNNNAICTAASVTPLNELTDKKFRTFIFSCVSHVLTQQDLREPLNYTNTQVLSNVSELPVPSTGDQDVQVIFKQ
jgi:hypothetical protein